MGQVLLGTELRMLDARDGEGGQPEVDASTRSTREVPEGLQVGIHGSAPQQPGA